MHTAQLLPGTIDLSRQSLRQIVFDTKCGIAVQSDFEDSVDQVSRFCVESGGL